jgi:hypothetical protein
MDKYLFPNFLLNPAEYAQAEALWVKRWKERREYARDRDEWKAPWLSTAFANGTPFGDGNPIFSAVSPSRLRGIRVIQLEPSADSRDLCFWLDVFDKDGPEKIDELVISCVLTSETLSDAMDMMSQWMDEGKIDLSQQGYCMSQEGCYVSQEGYYPKFPTGSRRGTRRMSQLVSG